MVIRTRKEHPLPEPIVGHDTQDYVTQPLRCKLRRIGIMGRISPVYPQAHSELLGEQTGNFMVEPGWLRMGRRERQIVLVQPHHQFPGRAYFRQTMITVFRCLNSLHLLLGAAAGDPGLD